MHCISSGSAHSQADFLVYPEARHEIYNELNKQEVYDNTLAFIEAHL
jgi:alpha-beta hydrolase superfamily lysophospholipase